MPYLIEIIEQMDNENEFLIKIAEGFFELKPYCKDYDECYILLPPLKILASLDQPSVREKAIESIQKLINGLDQGTCPLTQNSTKAIFILSSWNSVIARTPTLLE